MKRAWGKKKGLEQWSGGKGENWSNFGLRGREKKSRNLMKTQTHTKNKKKREVGGWGFKKDKRTINVGKMGKFGGTHYYFRKQSLQKEKTMQRRRVTWRQVFHTLKRTQKRGTGVPLVMLGKLSEHYGGKKISRRPINSKRICWMKCAQSVWGGKQKHILKGEGRVHC